MILCLLCDFARVSLFCVFRVSWLPVVLGFFVVRKRIVSRNYKILIKETTLELCPRFVKWLPTILFILAALESPSTPSCATGTSPRNSLSASSGVRGIVIERTKKKEQIGVTKRGKC